MFEYKRRLKTVSLVLVFCLMLVICLVLLPVLLNVSTDNNRMADNVNNIKNRPASSDYMELEKTVKNTKLALDILKRELPTRPHIADSIAKALANKPSGVAVKNITWFFDEAGQKLALSGESANRDSLRKYANILKNRPFFSEVELPVSNYAKSEDADFYITLRVK